jgi:cytochrome c oxidase cbb3-type subunit 3
MPDGFRPPARLTPALAVALLCAFAVTGSVAEPPPKGALPLPSTNAKTTPLAGMGVAAGRPDKLLRVPVSGLFPGAVNTRPRIKNPLANDPGAVERGMRDFTNFNCVGCHAPNGGGGIGPALSNQVFIYGSEPENIYLTIFQGRPNGMPAWGSVLPDSTIWELVTYIQSISNEPNPEWGVTTSAESPKIQQAPAEFVKTPKPWSHTQPFGNGQKPKP